MNGNVNATINNPLYWTLFGHRSFRNQRPAPIRMCKLIWEATMRRARVAIETTRTMIRMTRCPERLVTDQEMVNYTIYCTLIRPTNYTLFSCRSHYLGNARPRKSRCRNGNIGTGFCDFLANRSTIAIHRFRHGPFGHLPLCAPRIIARTHVHEHTQN